MARPRKEGMDYFPHDTDARNDKKVKALRMLYGNDGYVFYFTLLEMIYREPNFELDVSDAETIQILHLECGINLEVFNQILKTALKRECFDRDAYEERRVLTSNGVKKRASLVVEKRQKMRDSYGKQVSGGVSDAEMGVGMPQSKSKSKSKDIKDIVDANATTRTIKRFIQPTLEDVKAYCDERLNDVDAEKWYDHYTAKGWKIGRDPMKDWKAAVRTWEKTSTGRGSSTVGKTGKAAKMEETLTQAEWDEQERLRYEAMMKRTAEI